jgi:hypothetical protein
VINFKELERWRISQIIEVYQFTHESLKRDKLFALESEKHVSKKDEVT